MEKAKILAGFGLGRVNEARKILGLDDAIKPDGTPDEKGNEWIEPNSKSGAGTAEATDPNIGDTADPDTGWLKPYLDETDLQHSSTRLVFILIAFLVILIGLAEIAIAFTTRDIAVMNSLTALASLLLGVSGIQKTMQKKFEDSTPNITNPVKTP